jgi:hypothetical protein
MSQALARVSAALLGLTHIFIQTMSTSNIYQFEPSPTFAAWFRALIGQTAPNAESTQATYIAGQKEGQFMRMLFKQRAQDMALNSELNPALFPYQQITEPTTTRLEQSWQALRQRAMAEGLWTSQAAAGQAVNQSTRSAAIAANQSKYALAASVAVLAIGLTIFMQQSQQDAQTQPDEVVFRGNEQAQRLSAPAGTTPAQLADQIETVLKAQAQKDPSIRYTRKQISPTVVQIQAKVTPQSEAAKALTQLGVVMPEHGRLNLVIEAGK